MEADNGVDGARRLCADDARLAAVVRHDARLEWRPDLKLVIVDSSLYPFLRKGL